MKKIGKTEKKDVVEKKFWKQTSFRVWVVMAALIAITVPIVIVVLIARMMPLIFPLRISWLTAEILLFLGFLGLWIWPKKYLKQIFLAGIAIGVLIAVEKPIVVLPGISWITAISWVVAEGLVFLGLGIWLKKCLSQIGTIEVPSQAVLTRFAKPIDAMGPGLYFCFFPFEKFKKFPTGQYCANYRITEGLYSKEEGKLKKQPLQVDITVYFRFPKVDRLYSFPVREITQTGEKGELTWKRVSGRDLLMKLYSRLPIKDLTTPEAVDQLGRHFEKGIMGAARHVMAKKNSQECTEEKETIEEEMKKYLLEEEGNPFFECGLPKECLDIELPKVKLPDETEKAYIKPELAMKDAEAAKHEQTAISRRLAAYTGAGVSSDIAAFAVGGVQGKGMTTEQIRDLVILHAFKEGVIPFGGSPPKQKRS
ncbi:hypothetical protein KJA13_03900 [Patescibacteria group bacterium]|nr:hypothetical protein [Patescibacteria group bacterium]